MVVSVKQDSEIDAGHGARQAEAGELGARGEERGGAVLSSALVGGESSRAGAPAVSHGADATDRAVGDGGADDAPHARAETAAGDGAPLSGVNSRTLDGGSAWGATERSAVLDGSHSSADTTPTGVEGALAQTTTATARNTKVTVRESATATRPQRSALAKSRHNVFTAGNATDDNKVLKAALEQERRADTLRNSEDIPEVELDSYVSSLTVVALKDALRARRMPGTGNKAALQQRLQAARNADCAGFRDRTVEDDAGSVSSQASTRSFLAATPLRNLRDDDSSLSSVGTASPSERKPVVPSALPSWDAVLKVHRQTCEHLDASRRAAEARATRAECEVAALRESVANMETMLQALTRSVGVHVASEVCPARPDPVAGRASATPPFEHASECGESEGADDLADRDDESYHSNAESDVELLRESVPPSDQGRGACGSLDRPPASQPSVASMQASWDGVDRERAPMFNRATKKAVEHWMRRQLKHGKRMKFSVPAFDFTDFESWFDTFIETLSLQFSRLITPDELRDLFTVDTAPAWRPEPGRLASLAATDESWSFIAYLNRFLRLKLTDNDSSLRPRMIRASSGQSLSAADRSINDTNMSLAIQMSSLAFPYESSGVNRRTNMFLAIASVRRNLESQTRVAQKTRVDAFVRLSFGSFQRSNRDSNRSLGAYVNRFTQYGNLAAVRQLYTPVDLVDYFFDTLWKSKSTIDKNAAHALKTQFFQHCTIHGTPMTVESFGAYLVHAGRSNDFKPKVSVSLHLAQRKKAAAAEAAVQGESETGSTAKDASSAQVYAAGTPAPRGGACHACGDAEHLLRDCQYDKVCGAKLKLRPGKTCKGLHKRELHNNLDERDLRWIGYDRKNDARKTPDQQKDARRADRVHRVQKERKQRRRSSRRSSSRRRRSRSSSVSSAVSYPYTDLSSTDSSDSDSSFTVSTVSSSSDDECRKSRSRRGLRKSSRKAVRSVRASTSKCATSMSPRRSRSRTTRKEKNGKRGQGW